MRVRNHIIYSTSEAELVRLQEEYVSLGRDAKLELKEGKLTVFAIPRGSRSRKQKRQDAKRKKRNG